MSFVKKVVTCDGTQFGGSNGTQEGHRTPEPAMVFTYGHMRVGAAPGLRVEACGRKVKPLGNDSAFFCECECECDRYESDDGTLHEWRAPPNLESHVHVFV